MADLQAKQFPQFFQALHDRRAFPWQEALAEQVCSGEWPEAIDLPTASGKTACLDIALFALALRDKGAARRIFFVVDRRVVVNEVYLRMCEVRNKLTQALTGTERGVLREVAGRLRGLACGNQREKKEGQVGVEDAPLFVSEMRGGAFRDENWVRNPLQPTVVASTIEQVGSRLLFRGHGVSTSSWAMHAGLIANDSLIFLDEAHYSRAFVQTLKRIEKYRGAEWASQPIPAPFHFVEMTANPEREPRPGKVLRLTDNDRKNITLRKRLQATKPTRLIEVNCRTDDSAKLVHAMVHQAIELAKTTDAKRVALFANRVTTAKRIYTRLRQSVEESGAQVVLVIGSMRAVDQQDLYRNKLKELKSDVSRKANGPLTFVVSTQCLEVGSDLDFDVVVSECASMEALQQRFGRLDRMGDFGRARGAIVVGSWQVGPKGVDGFYGDALSKTWKWLKSIADGRGEINMGIESPPGGPLTAYERLGAVGDAGLRCTGEDAPVLLPAHVDMLAQTSPPPGPSPQVGLFLHGPKRGAADVYVVWRSDLDDARTEQEEIEIVSLCPPSSRETMPVPLSVFTAWLVGEKDPIDCGSDIEGGVDAHEVGQHRRRIHVLAWDGDKSEVLRRVNKVRAGQTLVLRASLRGWDDIGHVPEGVPIDVGDRTAFSIRNSVSLRMHPALIRVWQETPSLQSLVECLDQGNAAQEEVEKRLREYWTELKQGQAETARQWPYEFLSNLEKLHRLKLEGYPARSGAYVLRGRQGRAQQTNVEHVSLQDHSEDVEHEVVVAAPEWDGHVRDALRQSARFHDYGKVDVRFQTWLRGGDRMAARFAPKPIAKAGNDVLLQRKRAGLPEGFSHELLSVMFAEKSPETRGPTRDLILHLIAAHHGNCRPFPPVTLDEAPEDVSYGGLAICKRERMESAPCRLDSGTADRFWRLTAKYGWWGLAYLEALLRLADWQASSKEVAEVQD